nr:MAG TPA: hypothetical protein [Caudoviricetes sp.]
MLGPKMEMLVLTHSHDSLWKSFHESCYSLGREIGYRGGRACPTPSIPYLFTLEKFS